MSFTYEERDVLLAELAEVRSRIAELEADLHMALRLRLLADARLAAVIALCEPPPDLVSGNYRLSFGPLVSRAEVRAAATGDA